MFMLWCSGVRPPTCIVLSPTRCTSLISTIMKIFNVQSAEISECPWKNHWLKHLTSQIWSLSHTRCWDTLIFPHVKIVQSNNRWGKFLHISRLISRHYFFVWSDHLYLLSLLICTGDIISMVLGDLFTNLCYFSRALWRMYSSFSVTVCIYWWPVKGCIGVCWM